MAPERRFDLRHTSKWTVPRPRLRSAAQNRWRLWSRSLATRHLRLVPGRDLLELVVVHPRALVRILRERWLITSRQLHPRIELAIHAILRLTINQQHRYLATHTGAQSSSVGMQTAPVPLRSTSSAAQTLSKPHAPGKAFDKNPSPHTGDVVFNVAAPLTMVFRRVQETHNLTHPRVLEALMNQREHSITRRVTERARRIETVVTTASTLTRPRTVSLEMESIPSASMKLAHLTKVTPAAVKAVERSITVPTNSKFESPSSQKDSASLPDLNLDQITDQVVRRLDQRVIALRERMGRV